VARADMKVDRGAGTLHVNGVWLEGGISETDEFSKAFNNGLEYFIRSLNIDNIDQTQIDHSCLNTNP
jgi:uncharacterized protein YcaQ